MAQQPAASPVRRLLAVLALSSLAAVALVAFRLYYGGTRGYSSLPWDLFLAWVPVPLAFAAARLVERRRKPLLAILVLAFLWLLFFPNAPYLLTEFMHLHPSHGIHEGPLPAAFAPLAREGGGESIPLWYDVMMISTFAWTGLLLGFLSLHVIHGAATCLAGRLCGWAVAVLGIGLCAFGITLGRFERWNSWDIFSSPLALMGDVMSRATNPMDHLRTSAVTILFAAFLLLGYMSWVALVRFSTANGDSRR
jgi:uncharacterized membrane protein